VLPPFHYNRADSGRIIGGEVLKPNGEETPHAVDPRLDGCGEAGGCASVHGA